MASRKLEYDINVDSSKGVSGIKDFSKAVSKELKSIEGDFDDTATAGERVAAALSQLAGKMDTELDQAATAAEALRTALGEVGERADIGEVIVGLQRMGLTFEDITQDADKLAASLKEMDQVQLKGLDSGLAGIKTSVGEIPDSARGANSALANMIGNATQDLGALGGVAGSAGVAIGQIGEYAADAALGGEKLSSALLSMSAVAGPIAAIAIATQAIGDVMASIKAEEAFNAEQVDKFADALKEGEDAAKAVNDTIRETSELPFFKRQDNSFLKPWQGLTKEVENLIPVLARLNLHAEDFNRLAKDPNALKVLRATVDQLGEQGKLTPQIVSDYEDLATAVDQYAKNQAAADLLQQQVNRTLTVTTDEVKASTEAWKAAADPISQFPATYAAIAKALREGVVPDAKDMELIMESTGASMDEILTNAQGINDKLDESKRLTDEWKRSVDEVKVSAAEAMGEFDAQKIETVTTALGDFLAARQPGVTWLDVIADTKEAVGEMFAEIRQNKDEIPDIFATSTEKGRDFRDAIGEASDSVNQQLLQALENAEGDFRKVREQADALREQMIEKIEMRTGLSMDVPEEKEKILGLVNAVVPTDKQIEVGIALAKDDLAKLKAQLSIETLQGLLPATALQLQVELAEGEMTPREAAATAQQILNENGVDVDLDVNTKKADDDLVAFAREERNSEMGVEITDKSLEQASTVIDAGPGGRGWPAIQVPVIPILPPGYSTGSGGSNAPDFNRFGPAGRYAVAAPPATAPAAAMAPLEVPVRPVVINQNVTVNGLMRDDYDVVRAIDLANRKAHRLFPVHP